jgi:ABC-type sugar transport system substrate-binding protein
MKRFGITLIVLVLLVTAIAPIMAQDEEVNPYSPTELFAAVDALKEATKDGSPPADAKFVLLTNAVAPFWTAAQTGASRASLEFSVPIMFQAPTAAEKLVQQLTMLETFVNDGYTAITFSSIDRDAPAASSNALWKPVSPY